MLHKHSGLHREDVLPIILAGGIGQRLWPYSNSALPKQLMALCGDDSLLISTIKRMQAISSNPVHIITSKDLEGAVYQHLFREAPQLLQEVKILPEPHSSGTALSVAIAAAYTNLNYQNATMIIAPSDHAISDDEQWNNTLAEALRVVEEEDQIVLLGIAKCPPNAEYGLILLGEKSATGRSFKVKGFAEKPDGSKIEELTKENSCLVNSGIFVLKPKTARRYLAEYYQNSGNKTFEIIDSFVNQDVARWQHESFNEELSNTPNISFDKAVIEKCPRLTAVLAEFSWQDLGSFQAIDQITEHDQNANTKTSKAHYYDSSNIQILSQTNKIITAGIKDVIIASSDAATLIMNKEWHGQGYLNSQLITSDTVLKPKPWGYYQVLEKGDTYVVKRIFMIPNRRLSRQYHEHKTEFWVVVKGTATIETKDGKELLHEGCFKAILPNEVHRLCNYHQTPLEVLEIARGDILSEDDITRLADDYGR